MAKSIRVDYLARVEGEGGLRIRFKGNKPKSVELRIFEPPRFFEAFLRGRSFQEVPDLTARICGICPVAYQMSSCHALEDALGVRVEGTLRRLRRLLYCGEWIESHVLHMFMLHAPDFLGFEDSIQMAKAHPKLVKDALAAKKAGNQIVRVLGGREIHPINVKVGGFYRVPRAEELEAMLPSLRRALDIVHERTVELGGLEIPALERDYTFVALRHPDEYPFSEGRLVSSRGLDIKVADYESHFTEQHVERSNALHATLDGGSYLCGPLARINLNFDRLGAAAKATADEAGFTVPCTNPFMSLLARGIEVVQVLAEAIDIIETYERPEAPSVEVKVRAGQGSGCTEAPRGILFHRYEIDDDGTIVSANIVPPTSQNLLAIEEDLWKLAPRLAEMPHADATWLAEQAVRNYDPCISCATHFLRLKIEHEK